MVAELMGRSTAVCRGLGGSMRIADLRTFCESLNLAALRRLPVLFVCENNRIADFSASATQHPVRPPPRRGFGIESTTVDGRDVEAVAVVTAALVAPLREGDGPFLPEVEVERWHGHYEGDPPRLPTRWSPGGDGGEGPAGPGSGAPRCARRRGRRPPRPGHRAAPVPDGAVGASPSASVATGSSTPHLGVGGDRLVRRRGDGGDGGDAPGRRACSSTSWACASTSGRTRQPSCGSCGPSCPRRPPTPTASRARPSRSPTRWCSSSTATSTGGGPGRRPRGGSRGRRGTPPARARGAPRR